MTLKDIYFGNVEWLKYAEAKNAIVLILAGIAIPILADIIGSDDKILRFYAIQAVVLLFLSCIVTLSSFVPILIFADGDAPTANTRIDNASILYFEDIAATDRDDYINILKSNGFGDTLVEDIGSQVWAVARITKRKMQFFEASIILIVGAFCTPVFFIIYFILKFFSSRKSNS